MYEILFNKRFPKFVWLVIIFFLDLMHLKFKNIMCQREGGPTLDPPPPPSGSANDYVTV